MTTMPYSVLFHKYLVQGTRNDTELVGGHTTVSILTRLTRRGMLEWSIPTITTTAATGRSSLVPIKDRGQIVKHATLGFCGSARSLHILYIPFVTVLSVLE
jgi:hypothetical protein